MTDDDIDVIIRILDRHGKGNTKESEVIAKVMVTQGAWRRIFHDFCSNKELSSLVTKILVASEPEERARHIDLLYKKNEGKNNNLTGRSGNVINAMTAAHDPMSNVNVISMKHRMSIIEHLAFPIAFDYESSSVGTRFMKTNSVILDGFKSEAIEASARTISQFLYRSSGKELWRDAQSVTREDKVVQVSIPLDDEIDTDDEIGEAGPTESIQMQAIVAEVGAKMGMRIWIPRGDRSRILKFWHPAPEVLLDKIPLNYDETAMKTIENIDVLWLNRRTIVRAFEVEHTTSIYSGLLRMADLVAFLPNIDIKLHIVAPSTRSEKVFEEIRRSVFSLLEGGALSEKCIYLSYDRLLELHSEKKLEFLKPSVLDQYSEPAE
ncbi:MAG: hypothetical protein M1339_05380 [Bacteroidetes bacterium]|nr:hypothetical protein [Bacteroidota bacterium]